MVVNKIDPQMFLKAFEKIKDKRNSLDHVEKIMLNNASEKINDMSSLIDIDETIMLIYEMTPSEALGFIDLETLDILICRCRALAENDTHHDLRMVKNKIIEVLESSTSCSTNFLGVF